MFNTETDDTLEQEACGYCGGDGGDDGLAGSVNSPNGYVCLDCAADVEVVLAL